MTEASISPLSGDFKMRGIILILTCSLTLWAEHYTFLVKPYQKEMELEAKIIAQVAASSLKEPVKLFIPEISETEQEVYGRYFTLSPTCETSNFVFVNKTVETQHICKQTRPLFFTNNYRKLLSDERFFGALFWSKSRPNIVFIKKRLEERRILLPHAFDQFIENF
jgi:hypothetical protein